MQDSNIVYKVTTVGVEEATAKMNSLGATITKLNFNQNGTVTASGKLTSTLNNQGKATDSVARATDRASKSQAGYFAHIARTTIQSAIINKLFLEFVDVSGQAIQQVDLMNNFPATMASMGQSTADASESMQALSRYVGQVGGNLGDAVSMVTRFTGATRDVRSATAIFVGLNNALIAGDSSLQEQRLAAIQFAQALERGKPDMREWLSLTQNMSFQLAQVATAMGFVSANALGEALRNGEVSMADFTTKLTELSTGSGDIAKQALTRMQGTQFAFNVLKNTMVQGLAAIINAFGRQNIVAFFTFLTQVVQVLSAAVVRLMGLLVTLFNLISRVFGGPEIQLKKDAEGVAAAIGAGAGSAGDLGDGLKDAEKDAKKLNKQLAAFDKMNVLTESDTGSGDDDKAAGGAGFNEANLGTLGSTFGDIGGGLQEASKWAKIFAGILGGLAANALINRVFGVNPIKLFGKAVYKHAILPLAHFAASAIGGGGSALLGSATALGTKIGVAIRSGIAIAFSGIGTILKKALLSPLGNLAKVVGSAVAALFVKAVIAVGVALGVSFGAAAAIVVGIILAIIAAIYLIWRNWETVWGLIKTVFVTFFEFLVVTWGTLFNIFKAPVEFLWKFWSAAFILIVAIVATALELIFKLIVGTVVSVFKLLIGVATWIYDNVVLPIANFFVILWGGIVNGAAAAWSFIFENVLSPVAGWIYNNVITPIFGFFKGLWEGVIGLVSGFFSGAKNILGSFGSWIFNYIILPVAGLFSGLWNGIKTGLSRMVDGLKSIFGGIGEIFKIPINGIIDLINTALRGLNKIKVPDWVPGLGGSGVNFPMIPKLATGGVVDQATAAILGENGSEAVVPLENNTEWIDNLASKINSGRQANTDPDIIPVTNRETQPMNHIEINVSGVFATSTQEQKRIADLIAKQIDSTLRAKGLRGTA